MDYETRGSISVYDYSDKSIQHAWVATLAYAGAKVFGAITSLVQGVAWNPIMIGILVIELMVCGFLAFWISQKSRVAAVLMLAYVIGLQLYVWFVMHSFSGTIVSFFVAGFLLRGTKRIFEHHAEQSSNLSENKSETA